MGLMKDRNMCKRKWIYIYYRRKDGLVAIEQDPQVMDMLAECESQKMVSLFVTKQRLATLAPTNFNKEPSKSK